MAKRKSKRSPARRRCAARMVRSVPTSWPQVAHAIEGDDVAALRLLVGDLNESDLGEKKLCARRQVTLNSSCLMTHH
jgi:hypothetical protein